MLSRAACAPRICLSCRLSIPRRAAGNGVARLLDPNQHHSFARQRRLASNSSNTESESIADAILTGRRAEAPPIRTARRRGRRTVKQKSSVGKNEDDPFTVKAMAADEKTTHGWRTDSLESAEDFKKLTRSAAEPDEDFPPSYQPTTRSEQAHSESAPSFTSGDSEARAVDEEIAGAQQADYDSLQDNAQSTQPNRARSTLRSNPFKSAECPAPTAFQHDFLRQQHISIDALGQRVDALIIKNPNRLGNRGAKIAFSPEQFPSIGELDWRSMLPTEDHTVDGVDEALRNIEELRPKDHTTLSRIEFDWIAGRLTADFTKEQLTMYYNIRKKVAKEEEADPADEAPAYAWLETQTAWKPSRVHEYERNTPKQQISRHIMIAQWKLQIQEEVENPGYASIAVKPDVFRLITHPSIGVLEALNSETLDDSIGETIVTDTKARTVELNTRKAAIPAILMRIDDLQSMMATRTISVQDVSQADLRADILSELGRVTRTIIVHDSSNSHLKVSWIPDEEQPVNSDALEDSQPQAQPSLATEDPADIVARLLRGRPSQKMKTTNQIVARAHRNMAGLKSEGTLVPHCRENRSMSWRQKMGRWERFVLPTGKHTKAPAKKLKLDDRVKFEPLRASPEEVNVVSATFGHVLHSQPEDARDKTKKKGSRRNGNRILAPVLPHPASLSNFLPQQPEDLSKRSSIVLNLVPHYSIDKVDGAVAAPELKLTMPVDTSGDLSQFSVPQDSTLHAICSRDMQDILLPDDSVDVRILQEVHRSLDMSEQPSLMDFLASCEFNLVGGRLRTPSETSLQIPLHWLGPSVDTQDSSSKDVPYSFAGLEIHQTLDLAWKNFTLRYSSIEAGQHGGTRADLSIVSDKLQSPVEHDSTEATAGLAELGKQWLTLVEEAVEGKHWSWDQGFRNARELPDADDPIWKSVTGKSPLEEAQDDEYYYELGQESEDEASVPGEFVDISRECEAALRIGRDIMSSFQEITIDAAAPVFEEQFISEDRGISDDQDFTESDMTAGISGDCEAVLAQGEDLARAVESMLVSQARRDALGTRSGASAAVNQG